MQPAMRADPHNNVEHNFRAIQQAPRKSACVMFPVSVYIVATQCLDAISNKWMQIIQPASEELAASQMPCATYPCQIAPIPYINPEHVLQGAFYTWIGTALSDASDERINFHARESHWSIKEAAKTAAGTAIYTVAKLATMTYFGVAIPSTAISVATGFALYATKRVMKLAP